MKISKTKRPDRPHVPLLINYKLKISKTKRLCTTARQRFPSSLKISKTKRLPSQQHQDPWLLKISKTKRAVAARHQ